MEICCGGGVDVLCTIDVVGSGGTGGVEDAGNVGHGGVTS